MAGHDVAAGPAGPSATLERYLADFGARLRGPRAAKTRVLDEVRDGLTDTYEAHLADGEPSDDAATSAIREFGDPASIARSFADELATASARRTIAFLIVTGPLVGVWWLMLLHPQPWRSGILASLVAIPALPLVALAIATAAGTFATTGRLVRWLPETAGGRALTAATAIALLCIAADLTVLCVLAAHLAIGWRGPAGLTALAVAASLVRICAASATIVRTRRTKAAISDG